MINEDKLANSMIRRIAQALLDYTFDKIDWHSIEGLEASYMDKARIAIGAMREPSDEMIAAAEMGFDWHLDDRNVDPTPTPNDCWHVMIDAALKDE